MKTPSEVAAGGLIISAGVGYCLGVQASREALELALVGLLDAQYYNALTSLLDGWLDDPIRAVLDVADDFNEAAATVWRPLERSGLQQGGAA